jgi:hypothetical protein
MTGANNPDGIKGEVAVNSAMWGPAHRVTGTDRTGRPRRTLQVSGTTTSPALQSAVEFFCSAASMRGLRERMGGFPPNYRVVVHCTISGMRTMSYHLRNARHRRQAAGAGPVMR